jgi:putative PIN family toxin of toxin-antitoxin system
MLRCVFDTNTVVSAALFRGSVPEQALFLALRIDAILMSRELADELNDVLSRPRFDRYADRENREEFLQDLVRQAESVEVTERVRACRDPKDDKILELAVNGNADFIVTGDDDLLVMNPFRNIEILRAAEFLAVVGSKQ